MDTTPVLKFANRILRYFPVLNILSTKDSIELLVKRRISLSRYGDGEMFLMCGNDICFQERDERLAARLNEILSMPYLGDFQVGIPMAINTTNGYNDETRRFWEENMSIYRMRYYIKGWRKHRFLNSSFTWLYSDTLQKREKMEDFENLLSLWRNKEILIVEGETTRLGVGTGMFQKTKSCRRLICPGKNSFAKYDNILDKILQIYRNDELVLLSLGPTATVLAYDLYKNGLWAVDIGQINKEYELYKNIKGTEEDVVLTESVYLSQIVGRL